MTFTEHDLGPEIPRLKPIERKVLIIGKEVSHDDEKQDYQKAHPVGVGEASRTGAGGVERFQGASAQGPAKEEEGGMTFWLAFAAGMFIGVMVGVFVMCLLFVARGREG